ncbi:unnamed protein product [Adineta steineri]|uniref:EGF-like domain-containing protein n=1 Tax=Adineta steineri TaxID=433720 RepID=A0A814QUC4_9BILA|nr:unnamed protein product [Adineta steineri]
MCGTQDGDAFTAKVPGYVLSYFAGNAGKVLNTIQFYWVKLPACLSTPCQNGGTCNTVDGSCTCKGQTSGPTCSTCGCQNGGTCSATDGSCQCEGQTSGLTCSTSWLLLRLFACIGGCQNGGTCDGNGNCQCKGGWTGTTCTTPPTCSPSVCCVTSCVACITPHGVVNYNVAVGATVYCARGGGTGYNSGNGGWFFSSSLSNCHRGSGYNTAFYGGSC